MAKLTKRGKDTSRVLSDEIELMEVYSLGDRFMSKSVLMSGIHDGGLVDMTELLQTSLNRRKNLQGFPVKMVSHVRPRQLTAVCTHGPARNYLIMMTKTFTVKVTFCRRKLAMKLALTWM